MSLTRILLTQPYPVVDVLAGKGKGTRKGRVFCLYLYSAMVGGVAQGLERRSLAGELSLSCARPAADG